MGTKTTRPLEVRRHFLTCEMVLSVFNGPWGSLGNRAFPAGRNQFWAGSAAGAIGVEAGGTASVGVAAAGSMAVGAGAAGAGVSGVAVAGVGAAGASVVGVWIAFCKPIAGAASAAFSSAACWVAGAAASGAGALKSFFWISVFPLLALAVRMESRRVIAKKTIAIQVVKRASTFVVWDPKTLSVIPPPKAEPRPSLRGLCIRTTSTNNRQTMTCNATKIGIRIDINESHTIWPTLPK